MSTTAPFSERMTTAVLLALWKRPETTVNALLRETLYPLPDVQQALTLLRDRRCQIEQTPTSLRLAATGIACWQDILQDEARRKNLRIGRRVMVFHRTASTNDIAWQAAANPDSDGLLVLADEQSAGRGRLGHTWNSKPEQSILMSLLLRDTAAESLDRLTLLAGLAAASAIEHAITATLNQRIDISIKWPNDLMVGPRKLAGVLVERRGEHVVVGLGINVAQAATDFPPEVAPRATSIYQATGQLIDRLRIVTALLENLDTLKDPHDTQSNDAWIDHWKARCSMLGTRITARSNGDLLSGVVLDVDPLRGLVIRADHGGTQFLSAQTTTLSV
jgi:BirA family biotin operon repressor/biotin-[acetyl-CoA-carboxylase] ligase